MLSPVIRLSIIKKKLILVFSVSLFGDVMSDDEEDEMENFIVDDGKFYGKGSPMRYIMPA